jgi:hypothetical protein
MIKNSEDFATNHTLHEKVAKIYGEWQEATITTNRLDAWLEKAAKGDSAAKWSKLNTQDDQELDALKTALAGVGVTHGATQNAYLKLHQKGDIAGFNQQIALSGLAEDSKKILREYAPVTPEQTEQPEQTKRKSRKTPTANSMIDLGGLMYNGAFLDSKVADYVNTATENTSYADTRSRTLLNNALSTMISGVASGRISNEQFEALRVSIEGGLGESGKNLMDTVLDMAGYHTKSPRFEALKNPKPRLEAVDALDKLMVGKTANERVLDPRTALNKLMTAYLDDADTRKTGESSTTKNIARMKLRVESLREAGEFDKAVKIDALLQQAVARAKVDQGPYEQALTRLFGTKAKAADVIVRNYAKTVAYELESNGRSRGHGTGEVAERMNDGLSATGDVLDENNPGYVSALTNPRLSAEEKQEVGATQANETGVEGDLFDSPPRFFGQTARTPDKDDGYPGAPLTRHATYDFPKGELDELKDRVKATWGGARDREVSVTEWASERAGDNTEEYGRLLNGAAKELIEHDARTKAKLEALPKGKLAKLGQTHEEARELVRKELTAINMRSVVFEKVNGDGQRFFAEPVAKGYRYIETAPATGEMLTLDRRDVARFTTDEAAADQHKRMIKFDEIVTKGGELKLVDKSKATPEAVDASFIPLRAKDGNTHLFDIGGAVNMMMKRNPEENIVGVGEKNVEMPFVSKVRSAYFNTLGSLFTSGVFHDNMLVEALKGETVIYRDDKTGQSLTLAETVMNPGRALDVNELKLIAPTFNGPKEYQQADKERAEGSVAVAHARDKAAKLGDKFVGENKLHDGKGNFFNFNPRALLKAMMERNGINADAVMPAVQSSEGLSKELTGKLLREGLDLLKASGYEMSVGRAEFTKEANVGGLVLWEKGVGEDSFATTVSDVADHIFAQQQDENSADYNLKGSRDVRSDEAVALKEILAEQTKRLTKYERDLRVKKVITPESKNAKQAKNEHKAEVLTLEFKVAEKKAQIERTEVKLQEFIDGGSEVDTHDPLKYDMSELENMRLKQVRNESKTGAPKNGALTKNDVGLFEPALFDLSAEKVYREDGDVVETWSPTGIAPDRTGRMPAQTNRQIHVNAEKVDKDIGSAAKQSVAKAEFNKPYMTRNVKPVDASAAGKVGATALVKPDTMTVENTTTSVNPERNTEYAKAGRYARYQEVKAALDARRTSRVAGKAQVKQEQTGVKKSISPEDSLDVMDDMPEGDTIGTVNDLIQTYEMPSSTELRAAAEQRYGKNDIPGPVKALWRRVNELERKSPEMKFSKQATGKPDTIKTNPNIRNSKQDTAEQNTAEQDTAEQDPIEKLAAEHRRRLGEQVDLLVAAVLGKNISGGYEPSNDVAKALVIVSMGAKDVNGTLAHENWHAVADMLRDMGEPGQKILEMIDRAMALPETFNYLGEQLVARGEDPFANDGAFSQLKSPEERAAFAFQFFIENGGKMPIAPAARNIFTKLWALIKNLAGITDDLVRTKRFFEYFDSGRFAENHADPQKMLEVLRETRREKFIGQIGEAVKPLRELAFAAFGFAGDRIKAMNIAEYSGIFERMHVGVDGSAGYMKEQKTRHIAFANKYYAIVDGLDSNNLPAEAQKKINALIAEVEKYKRDAGSESYDLSRKTMPPAFDNVKLEQNLAELREDLKKYSGLKNLSSDKVEEIVSELLFRGYYSGKSDLFNGHPEILKKYATDDVFKQANDYFKKSTHDAEIARSFQGSSLEEMLAKGDEKATGYQRRLIRTFVDAALGRAGMDMNPNLRKLFGTVITGVNLSLLPFAVFSQMIEPLQLAFRKGDLSSAIDSAFRGFKGLPRSFESVDAKAQKDIWEKITSEMGLVSDAGVVSMMADLMNEVPITGMLDKVNKAFFRYNGMEFWHRQMHIAATKNAFEFIKEHDQNKTRDGVELLAELGLTRGKVKYDADGQIDYTDQAMRTAIIRFVNESMAQPDAGTNAMWMNDPRLSLLGHLKRFTFGFAYYINSRAVKNIRKGDYMSLLPLVAAIPWMIATDTVRDFIKPGDEAYKANWGVSDYVASGIERSSLIGRWGIAADVLKTTEYGGSVVEAISPTAQVAGKVARGVSEGHGWEALFNTLPGHQLYGS